jgi:hypothetical protein
MSATLRLARPFRLADAVWPYQIVLDGHNVGEIRNRATIQLPTSAGTHTLQIRSLHVINRHLGLASPATTFEVRDNETADFVCHPRPFIQTLVVWITCLFGDRSQWITLEGSPGEQVN